MIQVIETDETGRLELPQELMSAIKPHTKYVVETKGDGLVIYPQIPILTENESDVTPDEWQKQWRIVQEQVSQSWPKGMSAVDVISEMRR